MASKKSSSNRKKLSLFSLYFRAILAILLILFGVSLIFLAISRNYSLSLYKSAPSSIPSGQAAPKARPKKIVIPKISKSLYISDGVVMGNRWEVSSSGVSYLITTPLPGERGNSVLYGHNLKAILGDLVLLKNGDEIDIEMDNGKVFKYVVFEEKDVKPSEVQILNNTNDSRLTVYTCTGFLDSARFVVLARLVS